jgi:predicted dehydrogenase
LKFPLKIALVGCGKAAELIYLPAINKFKDIEIPAVVDPLEERRKLISKKIKNCFAYNLIKNDFLEQIDAAVIATPPAEHISAASELLKNNKYILVEKPLALSMNGIKELIEIESLSKASLMMAFNHRYWQSILDLKNMLPKIHEIDFAEIVFTGDYHKWNPVSFKSDPLDDLGPHLFDLIRFIFNTEITAISADSTRKNIFQMKVRIFGNLIINCHLSHSDKTIKSIEIKTNDKNFFVTLSSERTNPEPGSLRTFLDLSDMIKRKMMKKTSPIKKTYEIQLKNFFDLIRLNNQANPGIKDGVSAISAVEAARTSVIKNGKEFFLNEIR